MDDSRFVSKMVIKFQYWNVETKIQHIVDTVEPWKSGTETEEKKLKLAF